MGAGPRTRRSRLSGRGTEEPDEDTFRSRSIVLVQRSLYLIRPDTMDRVKLRATPHSPLLPPSSHFLCLARLLSVCPSPCVPRRAFATRNIDRRKLATARPLDSWLDPIYSADLGGPEFRFSSMEFSERPPRFDRQKFVRGWPSRPSIYIYIYIRYIF